MSCIKYIFVVLILNVWQGNFEMQKWLYSSTYLAREFCDANVHLHTGPTYPLLSGLFYCYADQAHHLSLLPHHHHHPPPPIGWRSLGSSSFSSSSGLCSWIKLWTAANATGIHAWRDMLYSGTIQRIWNLHFNTLNMCLITFRAEACQRLNNSSLFCGL